MKTDNPRDVEREFTQLMDILEANEKKVYSELINQYADFFAEEATRFGGTLDDLSLELVNIDKVRLRTLDYAKSAYPRLYDLALAEKPLGPLN